MIEPYKKKHLLDLLSLFTENENNYCYITLDNKRYYINDKVSLDLFLSNCKNIYIANDGRIKGIIASWKGKGGDTIRYYLKIFAIDNSTINKLLSFYLPLTNIDIYIKIDKKVPFLSMLFKNGFKFLHGRGRELLLIYNIKRKKEWQ